MAKKKSKKKKTQRKAKSVKDLVKKELTEEEKARLANYRKRSELKPVKFKSVSSNSSNPTIALKDPNDPLREVKMLEALGTPDSYLQSHLLDQVTQTFKSTVSTNGFDNDNPDTGRNISTHYSRQRHDCPGRDRFRKDCCVWNTNRPIG
ncbi:hypothetical protein ES703_93766 [subsurface metagenome]